jgi:hypothetical protein
MNFNIIKTWLPGIFLISVMASSAMLWGGLALVAAGGGGGASSAIGEPPELPVP